METKWIFGKSKSSLTTKADDIFGSIVFNNVAIGLAS
jgi:hypothetical protein